MEIAHETLPTIHIHQLLCLVDWQFAQSESPR